jgi:hypothetical protein
MLKENQERIAWFDNPTERMKHTGQAIRDAAEKGGYGYRWWKANDIEHNEGYNALPMRSLTEHLNDPNFWKALQKARSWQDSGAWLFTCTDLWITSLSAKTLTASSGSCESAISGPWRVPMFLQWNHRPERARGCAWLADLRGDCRYPWPSLIIGAGVCCSAQTGLPD